MCIYPIRIRSINSPNLILIDAVIKLTWFNPLVISFGLTILFAFWFNRLAGLNNFRLDPSFKVTYLEGLVSQKDSFVLLLHITCDDGNK